MKKSRGSVCRPASILAKSSKNKAARASALLLAVAAACGATAHAQLAINPTWDDSIKNLTNAVDVETAIKAGITSITGSVTTQFADPVVINFTNVTTGLGASLTTSSPLDYSTYLAALQALPTKTAVLTQALANMPAGPNTGINNATQVSLTASNYAAIGQTATATNLVASNGGVNSVISLNLGLMYTSRTNPVVGSYDLQTTAMHEISEVLGTGGSGSALYQPDATPPAALPTVVGPLDFFRYTAPGTLSFTYDPTTHAYFSTNGGTTILVYFNQQGAGGADFGDWGNPAGTTDGNTPPMVQDAFGAPYQTGGSAGQNLAPAELAAFQAIGYSLVGVRMRTAAPVLPTGSYWLGGTSGAWTGAGNWSTTATGTPVGSPPTSTTDVVFSANGAANQNITTLGTNFTIHSLTDDDDMAAVVISSGAGTNTLNINGTAGTGISVGLYGDLTINANVNLAGASNTISVVETAVAAINGQLGGSNVIKTGAGTLTLGGVATYTGSTTINDGTLTLGVANALPTATTVTINEADGFGDAFLDLNGKNTTIAGLTFVAPQNSSTVDLNGGKLTLTGNLNVVNNTTAPGDAIYSNIQDTAGGGALDLGGGTRTFNVAGQNNDNQDLIVDAVIQNGGVIINATNSTTRNNSAGVNFMGANTYAGGTTINSGYLLANNTTGSATGNGTVIINSGGTLAGQGTVKGAVTLNSGGALEAGYSGVGHGVQGTLTLNSVTWNGGGKVNLELGTTSDLLALTGALTKGTAGSYTITITDAGGLANQNLYTLATFASTTFAVGDFTLALPAGFNGVLSEPGGTALDLTFTTVTVGGSTIQNANPVGTPTDADFVVKGAATTGSSSPNTIQSLTFTLGSSLTINNLLNVTQSPVILPAGSTITLNGSLSTGELRLLFGSLLNGNGSILGNLINAGLASPGHSPGQIHVSGNYTQTSTGTLRIEIGGNALSQHDLLSVGGRANLDGTLQLVNLDGYKLKRNKPVTFLTADGGVSGKFATVINDFTSDTILQPSVVYHSNSVALEAVQGSFKEFAGQWDLTPNQTAVAGGLDKIVNNRRANSLIDYLDSRQLSKLPGDLEKISPDALTSIFTISTALAQVQSQNLQRRNDDLRSGASGFNAANLAINGDGPSFSGGFDITTGVAGPSGDDGKEIKETKEMKQVAPEEKRWGAFLSGTGEWVSVGNDGNARGYDLQSGGFTLGVDYKVCPNFAIGLMAGYTGTTSDLANNGRIFVNGGKIGLYATTFVGGWYADVAAFGGYNSYDTRRAGLQGDARGSTEGGDLNALFGTGYDFKKGGLTFGPTATFNYTYSGTDEFNETGSLAPLDVHGGKGESLRSAFGFKASYDWKVGGIVIKPELRAAWQHEYGDAAYSLDSSFANGGGGTFTVNGPKLGRDSALLGAGFAIQCSDRCSTYFYYDGELGRKNYQSSSVTGGIRIAF